MNPQCTLFTWNKLQVYALLFLKRKDETGTLACLTHPLPYILAYPQLDGTTH